jgi:hypothetical protein
LEIRTKSKYVTTLAKFTHKKNKKTFKISRQVFTFARERMAAQRPTRGSFCNNGRALLPDSAPTWDESLFRTLFRRSSAKELSHKDSSSHFPGMKDSTSIDFTKGGIHFGHFSFYTPSSTKFKKREVCSRRSSIIESDSQNQFHYQPFGSTWQEFFNVASRINV